MTEVKRGTLKFYHRGLLNKRWKEYRFILYDSSLLTWYADIKHKKPDGMVLLKDVERFICVGPYTRFLPDFPHLEHEYDQIALIAFPMSIKDRDRDIVWLLCEDVEDLNSWMKAIIQTLPSHTLRMERLTQPTSPSIGNVSPVTSGLASPEVTSSEPLVFQASEVAIPLAAGFIGSRLQGNAMNSKECPLKKAGYDYGDTLWGTGEGWGYFSPADVPGFAAIGGSGCYSNHMDLIRNEDDEESLKYTEDNVDESADAEEATYELSKNRDNNDEEESDRRENESEGSSAPSDDENDDVEDEIISQIEEDLQMIDSDGVE
ncbi:unnamed protein product [Adineta ricciae]|uniref:PH domain-containing protein n=1 Tax=Adineta ricciae TaxID=249248 RepID=A0A815QQ05_ADIRI|nr:unnamed protein product [Adineta ricciae]